MAGWDDLVSWVRVRYEVMAQREHSLTFRLPTTAGRDQFVRVDHLGRDGGHDWARIESPVGPITGMDLLSLLRAAGELTVGGAAAVNDTVVLRHALPLEDLSFAEFEAPFRLVTHAADDLERRLTGTDRY